MDAWQITAALLTAVSVGLTSYTVMGHLFNFNKPYLQRYIIRIVLMVPIYCLNAWVAMMIPAASLYLDASREVYESFVIYSFMKYLLNFLHYDTNLQQYIDHKPGPRHLFPFCLLSACSGGRPFMLHCKHGILQYVIVRPLTTLVAFTSQVFDFYGEGNYNPFSGYTYPVLLLINNASQIMAMYSLAIFYTGYRQELHPMQPLAKFFSIKLVIFFSFFQSVLISGLLEVKFIEDFLWDLFPDLPDKLSVGKKLQEFLICIDMLLASIGHQFAFSHRPFIEDDESSLLDDHSSSTVFQGESSSSIYGGGGVKTNQTCCDALFNLLDFTDEKSDVSEHFGQIFTRVESLFRFREPLPTVVLSTSLQSQPLNNGVANTRSPFPAPTVAPATLAGLHQPPSERSTATRVPIGSLVANKKNYESFD